MRLQVTRISEGPGPGEVVVAVNTTAGSQEQVIVHEFDIEGDTIPVGSPIHRSEDNFLVELPSESMSGRWRVWVPSASVAKA